MELILYLVILKMFTISGHFVVLCGYDCDKKHIFYKNPGIHQGLFYNFSFLDTY